MCNFFSFLSNGDGKYYYMNWEQRVRYEEGNADSHSEIVAFLRKEGMNLDLDKLNKFEYNPFSKVFLVDQINAEFDDKEFAEKWVRKLNFKKIVEPLSIKPIVNPLKLKNRNRVTKRDLENLKKWDSVRRSVWGSVRRSLWDSVGYSVLGSVRRSLWDSVLDSLWDSLGYSLGDSLRESVRDSVWDSGWGYIACFFDVIYEYDFSCILDLWCRGFVPSFDGEKWRLHKGLSADIVWEGEI